MIGRNPITSFLVFALALGGVAAGYLGHIMPSSMVDSLNLPRPSGFAVAGDDRLANDGSPANNIALANRGVPAANGALESDGLPHPAAAWA